MAAPRPAGTVTPWQSLRLLTPNWLSRLPGHSYRGPDPAGFMRAAEVGDYLRGYAALSAAPVTEGAQVLSVRRSGGGYRVVTAAGTWTAASVVLATGWCDLPYVPGLASRLDSRIMQLTPATYRAPGPLPGGGVLVVGASATGVQLADELAAVGRRVTLAAGSHTRVPRTYRGLDICWWLDAMGILTRRLEEHQGRPLPGGSRPCSFRAARAAARWTCRRCRRAGSGSPAVSPTPTDGACGWPGTSPPPPVRPASGSAGCCARSTRSPSAPQSPPRPAMPSLSGRRR